MVSHTIVEGASEIQHLVISPGYRACASSKSLDPLRIGRCSSIEDNPSCHAEAARDLVRAAAPDAIRMVIAGVS